MDDRNFDKLTRIFGSTQSRRHMLRALAGAAAGALLPTAARAAPCGKAGQACGCCRNGLTCTQGSCCPDERICNGVCCPSGHVCQGGVCVRSGGGGGNPGGSANGQAKCGTQGCIDISSDVANCGACGNVCPGSTDPCLVGVCRDGVCGVTAGNDGAACDDGDACTRTDTCHGGVCVGGDPVVCAALDQCHDAGTCDPKTGACSNPDKEDGVPCNDANACTLGDTCQGGVCTGGSPVVCLNFNPCVAAYCDPAIGCTSTPTPAGTSCPDFFRCDGSEVCDGKGNCVEGTPVVCDECNACDPITGICVPVNDGETCTGDGNRCLGTFVCQGGACVGEQTVFCEASDQCHDEGVCDPTTGLCSNPNKADDTVCQAGDGCTTGICQNGVCTATTCCTPGATRACYTGPVGTENVGICHGSTQTCASDGSAWGPCEGEVTPQGNYFYCNGLDNDCDGRIDNCPPDFSCQDGICFGNGGGGCFAAGARVTMADGTTKPIEKVRAGDRVRGRGGAANRVRAVEMPRLGNRSLYAVNDGAFLVTASHPFHTLTGLKSIDPDATAREPRGLAVDRLMLGDELLGDWDGHDSGSDDGHPRVSLWSIVERTFAPDTRLYNLLVGGDGSHTIGGVVFEEK